MAYNKTISDEERDTEPEEDIADIEEDITDNDDSDDEFSYDEDGNIIIPDVAEEDEEADEEEKDEDSEAEEDGGEHADRGEEEGSGEGEESAEPDRAPDERDTRIAQLEAELERFRSQGKETLAKLGVRSDDVMEGLVSLAAEADGITPQEYIRKKNDAERDAQARSLLQQQEFEQLAAADLAELHAAYPETQQYKHIRNLPEDVLKKFGRFRDAGLSAKEAYAAANPDGIRTQVATAVKKRSLHESKSHLHTAVPKSSRDDGIVMPKSELVRWRDLFPDKTDKEIITLYKNTAE